MRYLVSRVCFPRVLKYPMENFVLYFRSNTIPNSEFEIIFVIRKLMFGTMKIMNRISILLQALKEKQKEKPVNTLQL